MRVKISPALPAADEKKRHWPAVSIIMPFEPVIQRKDDIMQRLQKAVKKVEWEMGTGYDEDLADLVMLKLRMIIKNLNFSTFKKSLAIYVSPVFEKVMYLNIPVKETIRVNESFFIRDIIHSKKDTPAFFVLVLGEKWSSLYEGNMTKLVKVKSNGAGNTPGVKHTPAAGKAKDDDILFVKEFLQYTDEGLTIMLSAIPLPVLVVGNKKVLNYFKSLTHNGESIVEYIETSHGKAAEDTLSYIIQPFVADWDKIKVKHLYHQLEKATTEGMLVSGIEAVQQSISQGRGRLLVVGKSVIYHAEIPGPASGRRFNKFSCVRHTIDDIIEKVLVSGGDIEMVEDDVLGGQQMVLVKEATHYF